MVCQRVMDEPLTGWPFREIWPFSVDCPRASTDPVAAPTAKALRARACPSVLKAFMDVCAFFSFVREKKKFAQRFDPDRGRMGACQVP